MTTARWLWVPPLATVVLGGLAYWAGYEGASRADEASVTGAVTAAPAGFLLLVQLSVALFAIGASAGGVRRCLVADTVLAVAAVGLLAVVFLLDGWLVVLVAAALLLLPLVPGWLSAPARGGQRRRR